MHHVVLERWSRRRERAASPRPAGQDRGAAGFSGGARHRASRASVAGAALFWVLLARGAALGAPAAAGGAGARQRGAAVHAGVRDRQLAGGRCRRAALRWCMKSYLSALAVLLLVSTTPLPLLLRGLEMTGAPRFLLMVAQFLYRYLFVISEEAQHMREGGAARGATLALAPRRRALPRGGRRAGGTVRAIVWPRRGDPSGHAGARFQGHFRRLSAAAFGWADALFLVSASGVCRWPYASSVERAHDAALDRSPGSAIPL